MTEPSLSTPAPMIRRGTPDYRRVSLALFLAGFSTFSLIYCVQPLLPEFTRTFAINPAVSSLALSLTTGALALAIFAAGALSQLAPRRELMFTSMAMAAALNLLAAFAPYWPVLLGARLVEGLVLGGVPAVAMAYLAEEIDPRDLGGAMGLYVAGTALGGMAGRVAMGLMTEVASWRAAMAMLGGIDLVAAIGFVFALPTSRHFIRHSRFDAAHHIALWKGHLADHAMQRVFAIGFIVVGVFVALFNYAGFRLSQAPYNLNATTISLIFLTYLSGIIVSPLAGRLTDRFGRRLPLAGWLLTVGVGIALTLSASLVVIVVGILLVTVGFFGTHSAASGCVGRLAHAGKGHATSLYLLFYYMGSSLIGTLGGWFWLHLGWPGVMGMTLPMVLVGLVLALGVPERAAHD